MNEMSKKEIMALVICLGKEAKRGYDYLDGLASRGRIEVCKKEVDDKVEAILKYIETNR